MRIVTLLHRWTGGLLGLVLALFGLTGTILLHKDAWLRWTIPHAADPVTRDAGATTAAIARILAAPDRPRTIVLASDTFGLDRLGFSGGGGAYVDQAGSIVARWDTMWDRPELWLFDLHAHLLGSEMGETVGGIIALIGIGFVITGGLMWWRTRRTFAFRVWPKRMSRSAIVRHHRDLGIVVAPLLLFSFLTGAMMALRPVEALVLRPFASVSELAVSRNSPPGQWSALTPTLDWIDLFATAQRRYPGAALRVITLPAKPGAPITVRMRQADEWVPNGSTFLWFDPASGRLIGERDVYRLSRGARLRTWEYPLHAGKVGTLAWRLALTIGGLALTLLGTLAVVTFWRSLSAPGGRRH